MVGVLVESNRTWANKAPVLILTLAHTQFEKDGTPNRHAFYDLGQAAANLALQATALGLSTHQMGGFDVEAARERFPVPAGWEPVSVIALGYPGDRTRCRKNCGERETAQRQRKPLGNFVFSGAWGNPAPIADSTEIEMNETLQFVVRHGYMLVFAWVFVEQAGLPIPSAPLLLAAGALSGTHQMNLGLAIAICGDRGRRQRFDVV